MTLNLIAALVAVFILAPAPLKAEIDIDSPRSKTTTVRKRTTTIIEKDQESVDEDEESGQTNLRKESEITAKFGSKAVSGMSGCKTEDLAAKLVRELKSDCGAWLKDRKTELKGKFLTGSCEESCDDCGMHLQRCSVNGSVRYTVKTVN